MPELDATKKEILQSLYDLTERMEDIEVDSLDDDFKALFGDIDVSEVIQDSDDVFAAASHGSVRARIVLEAAGMTLATLHPAIPDETDEEAIAKAELIYELNAQPLEEKDLLNSFSIIESVIAGARRK
jgi:hypothetical protein